MPVVERGKYGKVGAVLGLLTFSNLPNYLEKVLFITLYQISFLYQIGQGE